MPRVRIDLNISLDGYACGAPTPDHPMGEDWGRLIAAYAATRTFRHRVLGDTSEEGTTGMDDAYARAYFQGVGAEIMGAGCSASTHSLKTRNGGAGGVTGHRSRPLSLS
jgi:hypothetical protein